MFVCVTLLILSGFMKTQSVAERFKVVGPEDPVVAHIGDDVDLPCFLQPNTNAENMTVSWLKKELTVHLYEYRADNPEDQAELYRGRTHLFKEELKNGNISLKLSAVQLFDDGLYTCLVESSSGYEYAKVYIKVEVAGKYPTWMIAVMSVSPACLAFAIILTFITNRKKIKRKFTEVKYSAIAREINRSHDRDEFDLRNYDTTQDGYMRLIPVIPKFKKARLVGCILSEELLNLLRDALKSGNSLKELDLSENDWKNFSSGFSDLLNGLNLKVLRLRMCNLSEESCDTVQKVLSSLKELDLSYNELKDSGVQKLCGELKSSHCKLEAFRLAGCGLTEQACKHLGSVLQLENSSLKELDLSYNDLTDSRLEKFCPAQRNPQCKEKILRLAERELDEHSYSTPKSVLESELDLSYSDLQHSGVEKLCEGLKSENCKLEKLTLVMCKMNEVSCVILTSVLNSQQNPLKQLDLSNNDLEDSGVEKLCEGLKSSQCKLETLRLAMCEIRKKSCVNLVSVLNSEQNSLKELDLSNNDLEDSGVEMLCEGLKSENCKLETLRLSGCMIREEGWTFLASALNSYLKELDLRYNNPGKQALTWLTDKKDSDFVLEKLKVDHEGEDRIKEGLKKYAHELTLDPNTAQARLHLKDKNKKVSRERGIQSRSGHSERFSDWPQVLCKESLTGRCYWETEWEGRDVNISVTYKSIERKGRSEKSAFGRNEKSWSLICSNNSYSVRHNNITTDLPRSPSGSKRVGVYVDYEAGILSFYSVSTDTLTHIYTFTTTFTEDLYAGFWVYYDCSVTLWKWNSCFSAVQDSIMTDYTRVMFLVQEV